MKTAKMKVSDLKPAAYNPRKTLQPGDQEYDALKNSMDRFGLAVPLIVNEKTGTLISGHQRLNVMKEAGEEEAEVVLVNLDEDREKLLNMSLNKIEGDWDYEKLEELFNKIPDEDVPYTGFGMDELENLFGRGVQDEDTQEWQEQSVSEEKREDSKQEKSKEFSIYISFPTKELAEEWMSERDIEEEFKARNRNITIRMEGSEYGQNN